MSVSNEYPTNSTAKVYYDTEGNEVTLRQLIKLEPEWAHSRIKLCEAMEKRLAELEKQVEDSERKLRRVGEGLASLKISSEAYDNGCAIIYKAVNG